MARASSSPRRRPIETRDKDITVEVTAEELDSYVTSGPTAEDVSYTYDGRVLDTKEKVLAFPADLDRVGPPNETGVA